jgi:hypothetical protein
MTFDPLWINVSASGTPSYTANEARAGLAALNQYGGRAVGARSGVRPGPTNVATYANPTVTVNPHVGTVDPGLSSTQGPYLYALLTAETHTAGAATTNPRKDIVVVRIYDHDEDASGFRFGRSELIAGTPAGSPVEPAVPAGAFKIATLDVPNIAGGGLGSAVITQNYPFSVAAGGILPTRNAADEGTLTPFAGMTTFRLDSGLFVVRNHTNSAWRYLGEIFVCTSGTRPSAPAEGLTIYETDTNRIRVYDGATWQLVNYGNQAVQASVETPEQTASVTFTDLATPGPSVAVHLESGQKLLVIVDSMFNLDASGTNGAIFSFEIAGPSTSNLAADDANGCETGMVNEWVPGTKHTIFTATATGTHTCTMKYRRIASGNALFKRRRITAIPL